MYPTHLNIGHFIHSFIHSLNRHCGIKGGSSGEQDFNCTGSQGWLALVNEPAASNGLLGRARPRRWQNLLQLNLFYHPAARLTWPTGKAGQLKVGAAPPHRNQRPNGMRRHRCERDNLCSRSKVSGLSLFLLRSFVGGNQPLAVYSYGGCRKTCYN